MLVDCENSCECFQRHMTPSRGLRMSVCGTARMHHSRALFLPNERVWDRKDAPL